MPIHIVLVEPEIPQNTGNIARTCAATNSTLHLVEPLGFKIEDRYLKRAGLDYWNLLNVHVHRNIDELFEQYNCNNFYFASTKAKHIHSDISYRPDSFIFFGKETAGLPEELLEKHYDRCIRIPMREGARSLNLSNSVAIVVYEAMRQLRYPELEDGGNLTKF